MPDPKKRADRREQQSKEVEASQASLRANIDEARLVDESDKMLKRHRRESESDDAG